MNIFQDIGQQSPFFHINVQPVPIFRFRYGTEMNAPNSQKKQISTHGSLDIKDDTKRKFPPSISLRNFSGTAIIRCDLYQVIDSEMSKLHPNLLCRKTENGVQYDPIYEIANVHNNWTVEFPGLSIINTKKEDIIKTLIDKDTEKMKWYQGRNELDPLQENVIQYRTESDVINLNRVALGFEAYVLISDGIKKIWNRIAGPILSVPISNSGKVSFECKFFVQVNGLLLFQIASQQAN